MKPKIIEETTRKKPEMKSGNLPVLTKAPRPDPKEGEEAEEEEEEEEEEEDPMKDLWCKIMDLFFIYLMISNFLSLSCFPERARKRKEMKAIEKLLDDQSSPQRSGLRRPDGEEIEKKVRKFIQKKI